MQKKGMWFAIALGVVVLVGILIFLPVWQRKSDPVRWGKQLYLDGKFAEAASAFREAVKAHPTDDVAAAELGRTLIVLKRYDEAIQTLQQHLHDSPRAVEVWQALGEAYAGRHQPKEASDAYQHALALDSKRAHSHFMLGLADNDMGKKAEARAEWNQVILLDPQNEGKLAQKMINFQHR